MNRLLVCLALTLSASTQPALAWTINQNFDSLADGASCGWDAGGGSKVNSGTGYNGSKSCRLSVNAGDTAFGTWGGIIDHPSPIVKGQEVWFRVRTFMPSSFNYNSNGEGSHLKFMRIHTRTDATENLGYDDIYINPKGSTPPFQFIYEGEQVWSMIGSLSNAISLGGWETYEIYVKLDTVPVSKGGTAKVRFWKNGTLLSEINDRVTISSASAYSDRTHLFTYWNGAAPATQQMYVDDLTLTTDTPAGRDAKGNPFVGTGGAVASSTIVPQPPSNVAAH
jgi:hypothetical protein